jgi:hypothetical protein
MNSTLGERLESLRGVDKKEEKKKRGKKIRVPPGRSYTADPEEEYRYSVEEDSMEEEGDMEERDMVQEAVEQNDVGQELRVRAKKRRSLIVESSDDKLPDPQVEEEEKADDPGARCATSLPSHKPDYPIGSFVVAVYDKLWYIAQVEGEDPEEEYAGFTLLKYLSRIGPNQFFWAEDSDHLKTLNADILLKVDALVPVSSRFLGLPKDIVKKVEQLLRVQWSIIADFLCFISTSLFEDCLTMVMVKVV